MLLFKELENICSLILKYLIWNMLDSTNLCWIQGRALLELYQGAAVTVMDSLSISPRYMVKLKSMHLSRMSWFFYSLHIQSWRFSASFLLRELPDVL